jgi:uncharacterized protein (DUF3820 family)
LASALVWLCAQRHNPRLIAEPAEPAMKPEDLLLLVTREMPFGKHKGRLLADLPGNYLNWFAREGFPQGEIGRLLALMQEINHNGLSGLLDLLRIKPRVPFKGQ